MPIEKSAGAIVFRKKGNEIFYLLLQYEAGHWGFPRGLIEKGETLEETAKREIEEETGIKNLKFLPGFKETIKYFFKWKGKNILKFVTYFLAQTKEKKVSLSFEHKDFEWLPYKEALEKLTFENSKEVLKKAHQFLKQKNFQNSKRSLVK